MLTEILIDLERLCGTPCLKRVLLGPTGHLCAETSEPNEDRQAELKKNMCIYGKIGSPFLTMPKCNEITAPANAHSGAMPDGRILDGFCLRREDLDRFAFDASIPY